MRHPLAARAAALAFTIAYLVVGAAIAPVRAQDANGPGPSSSSANAVMLLVDTSGSMGDDDGTGRIKIDGARTALIDFVRSLPPNTAIGLRSYPGGTEEDAQGCSKGQLRFPLIVPDLTAVDANIRSLTADGDTPTAAALTQAAADIKAAHQSSATIVLVSDGESNCGDDPCKVAQNLSASGVDITIFTVGFQISTQGAQQLQCIANATHGLYNDVNNTQQLIDELNQLSHPLLDIKLDYPRTVRAVVGTNGSGTVDVRATITVTSAQPVNDAQAAMSFTATEAPAVLGPRRRFGNLQPGETRTVTWTFRPPLEDQPRDLTFTVSARGSNSPPAVSKGTISLNPNFDQSQTGPLLSNAHDVAILGDSYSSGEGAGDYLPGTDTESDSCHQSPNTYAVSLFGRSHVKIVACSGATTRDISNTKHDSPNVQPQLQALDDHAYDLVLMTIGGNDVGFGDIIKRCLIVFDCEASPLSLGHFWKSFGDAAFDRIKGLETTVAATLRQVDDSLNSPRNLRARHGTPAPTVLLAYPAIGPAHFLALPNCGSLSVRYLLFDPSELQFFEELETFLNAALAGAVKEVRSEGRPVYFATDTADALQPNHHVCSADPWLNTIGLNSQAGSLALKALASLPGALIGLSPTPEIVRQIIAKSVTDDLERAAAFRHYNELFHPTTRGYEAITAELARWSTSSAGRVPVHRSADPSGLSVEPLDEGADVVQLQLGADGASVQPADGVEIQGSGFEPGAAAELVLRSSTSVVDNAVVKSDGTVIFRDRLPKDLPIGTHTLAIMGTGANGKLRVQSVTLHVHRPRPWWVIALAVIAALLTIAGILLWQWRRRYELRPEIQ